MPVAFECTTARAVVRRGNILAEPAHLPRTEISRRAFLAVGAGSMALTVVDDCCGTGARPRKSAPTTLRRTRTSIPRGSPRPFAKGSEGLQGRRAECIGMPIGGICAGQLYLRGDGTLAEWGIFNVDRFTGYGDNCYRTYTPPSPVRAGVRALDHARRRSHRLSHARQHGLSSNRIRGEYPIGTVRYRTADGDADPRRSGARGLQPVRAARCAAVGHAGDRSALSRAKTSRKSASRRLSGGWIRNPVGQRHVGRYSATRSQSDRPLRPV